MGPEGENTAVAKTEAAGVEERRAELAADTVGDGLGALDDDAAVGGVRDAEVVGEEGEDRAEVGADAGVKYRQELRRDVSVALVKQQQLGEQG
uniref:DUF834 domain-containing protein n=1 Tax=Oryza barthii TaxID=65489 RepID=A0A0D3G0Y8_9ORYZ